MQLNNTFGGGDKVFSEMAGWIGRGKKDGDFDLREWKVTTADAFFNDQGTPANPADDTLDFKAALVYLGPGYGDIKYAKQIYAEVTFEYQDAYGGISYVGYFSGYLDLFQGNGYIQEAVESIPVSSLPSGTNWKMYTFLNEGGIYVPSPSIYPEIFPYQIDNSLVVDVR